MKRITIFHGKSDLTAKKRITAVIRNYIPELEKDMAVTQFRSYESGDGNSKKEEVLAALFSLPLGCSRQLVVVWHYQNFFSFSQLRKTIPLVPNNTWVVLVSDISLTEREKKKFAALSDVEVINEYFVKWDEIKNHLQNFLRKQELKMGREVQDRLVKIFSENPASMDNELEKVAAYFSPGQLVTLISLEGIILLDRVEQMAYGVVNQFFEKKIPETLLKFRQYLLNQGELPLLITVMIRELVLIVKFKEMKFEKKPLNEIFQELRVIYDKHKKSLQAKDVFFTYSEITRILEECFRIDKGIRQDSFISMDVDKPRVPLKARLQFERLLTVVI